LLRLFGSLTVNALSIRPSNPLDPRAKHSYFSRPSCIPASITTRASWLHTRWRMSDRTVAHAPSCERNKPAIHVHCAARFEAAMRHLPESTHCFKETGMLGAKKAQMCSNTDSLCLKHSFISTGFSYKQVAVWNQLQIKKVGVTY